mgnify:CR=1 FL=1
MNHIIPTGSGDCRATVPVRVVVTVEDGALKPTTTLVSRMTGGEAEGLVDVIRQYCSVRPSVAAGRRTPEERQAEYVDMWWAAEARATSLGYWAPTVAQTAMAAAYAGTVRGIESSRSYTAAERQAELVAEGRGFAAAWDQVSAIGREGTEGGAR